MKMISQSPTSLNTFLTCPYQYRAKYITKEVKFQQNKHAEFGSAVHGNIENYLNGEEELSEYLSTIKPTLDKIKLIMVGAETKYQITKWNTRGKSFFDPDVYLKCIVDCVALSADSKTIVAFDWKTGKKSDQQVQHDIIKRCLAVYYPEVQNIVTCFWYFVKGAVDIQFYTPKRKLLDLEYKLEKVEAAHKSGEFPYNPNGLCKAWCDVLSCPHNGKNK